MQYTRWLKDVNRADVAAVGAKAANLGEVTQAGFRVPDGFALITDAFDHFLAANGLSADSSQEMVAAAALPSDVTEALLGAAASLRGVPLAVRSSSVAEDQPGASFAGQYETVLGVRGADALVDAVRRCWASAFSLRVAAYRATADLEAKGMAVLIQTLVPAEAAGVAFTANPLTGDRAETVVSAVRGLGERLVSGEASPDEWVVKDGQAVCRSAPEGALDAARVSAVADLARRVEGHFGCPQDIEWAFAGGELFLLQARPITAMPEPVEAIPVPIVVPPGYWQREASHAPKPLSPMMRWGWPVFASAMRQIATEFGLLIEGMELREIGGWGYQRMVPLGGKDVPPPPRWLMRVLGPLMLRLVPAMRSRVRVCVEAVRSDKAGRIIDRWYAEWQPSLAQRITELRATDLGSLTDEALRGHMSSTVAFSEGAMRLHGLLDFANLVPLGDLAFAGRDLGWEERRTLQLVSGLSAKSTEPAHRLAELARMARQRPAVRALLEGLDEATVTRLQEVDPGFGAAFAAYLNEYGCRALRYEVMDPTLAEEPALVLGLIRDQVVRGYDPEAEAARLQEQRAAAAAEARAALAGHPEGERARFESALARAERAYPVREDNEFFTVSAPLALMRYGLLELGRRLAERGAIEHRDDVFFLELDEAVAAFSGGGDRRALVSRRKAERAWVEAHPGPASYGKPPGAPPSFDWLPPDARRLIEILRWMNERVFAFTDSGREQEAGTELRGIAASPGTYTGPVRVIHNETEFDQLQVGDVLVCPITSPVWSVLFPSVGALVTDTGGILSHSAIIAREYGIPAVVATGNATSLLRDGQVVTVDGTGGLVTMATS